MADNKHSYTITAGTVVFNNGSSDEKDRKIEQLEEEIKRLKAEVTYLKRIKTPRNVLGELRSRSSTESDDNIVSSNPSQPFANRFSDDTNNLSQGYDYINNDTDITDPKLIYDAPSRTARREPSYVIDPDYITYYENMQTLRTKNPGVIERNTRIKNQLHDIANNAKTYEIHCRMPNGPHPVIIQSHRTSGPPPLPERKQTARVPTASIQIGINERTTTNYNQNSGDDTSPYRVIGTLKTTRPQNSDNHHPGGRKETPYSQIVDESYLKTSNLNKNIEKDEDKYVRSKVYMV